MDTHQHKPKIDTAPDGTTLEYVGVRAKTASAVFRSASGYEHTEPATHADVKRGPIIFSPISEDSALAARRRTKEEDAIKHLQPAKS